MDHFTTTQESNSEMSVVQEQGPVFSLSEIERAHSELDLAGVPRDIDGLMLDLPARIAWMHGALMVYRALVGERQ